MLKQALASTLTVAALSLAAGAAHAAHFIDTGTPNGSAVGAYTLDGTDFFAGQVTFAGAAQISAVFAHVLGGTAGETFSILLYGDSAGHLPGALLRSATATFGVDGWNGVSGLSGWNVGAGSYWIGLELGADDTLGQGSVTGALLDRGVPHPLLHTAFDSGSGYQAGAFDLGLQVDAAVTPVPERQTGLRARAPVAWPTTSPSCQPARCRKERSRRARVTWQPFQRHLSNGSELILDSWRGCAGREPHFHTTTDRPARWRRPPQA